MIILHAGFDGRRLFLWGESSAKQDPLPEEQPKKRGRKPKYVPSGIHPYSLTYADLHDAAGILGLGISPGDVSEVLVQLALPTMQGFPVPSSPLVADIPAKNDAVIIGHWSVQALCLTNATAIELLAACAGSSILRPGIMAGHDLAFWVHALRLAAQLTAEQQYLPGIEQRHGTYWAHWRAFWRGEWSKRLKELAAVMPGSASAFVAYTAMPAFSGPESVPFTPEQTVMAFVDSMLDTMVRTAGANDSRPVLFPENIHDRWLAALLEQDGRLTGEREELRVFAAQVADWQRRLSITAMFSFRLCFRLEEPAGAEDIGSNPEESEGPAAQTTAMGTPLAVAVNAIDQLHRQRDAKEKKLAESKWYLRYLLQSHEDPSLFISVEDIWTAKRGLAKVTKTRTAQLKEYLLAALGQAAALSRPVLTSLNRPAPGGQELDTAQAYDFLTADSPSLELTGFGVLLPSWWAHQATKVHLSARVKAASPKLKAGGGMSLDQVMQFDWELALGGETITPQELQALAQLKTPLVKLRGQWVQLKADEIQAALNLWQRKARKQGTVQDILQLALGAGSRTLAGGLPIEDVQTEGWVSDLIAQLSGRVPYSEVAVPPGFQAKLRPYQLRGYSWLAFIGQWGLGACLADDMGLGKTVQTLAYILYKHSVTGPGPFLLVCPTSILSNWYKEAERFAPGLKVLIHHGADRQSGSGFAHTAVEYGLVVTSYNLLHRDLASLQQVKWAGIILDEAQNIKNPETRQAKAARALQTDCRIALTGTPVENNVGDLWSIMEFLNPGFLGSQTEFKRTFFLPIQVEHRPEAAIRLKKLTGPFVLRRLKTDKEIISDLPDKVENKVYCPLTREQASLYTAVVEEVNEILAEAQGMERRGLILSTLAKLKQICNHPAHFLSDRSPLSARSGKLERLTEMLGEIRQSGEKTLIFTQFAEMGGLLQRYLQETFGREVLFLHGAIVKKKRDELVERFQNDPTGLLPIFILSLKAGGTGLNLTGANHVFHFDRWWNPAVENQATDRAFRIGQTKNVMVHKFICAGTLEEKIDAMITSKQEIAGQVIGTGEGWLTELSTQELRELWALRQEAMDL